MRKPDKQNDNVLYYDDEHIYVDKNTNEKFISVTTLIHNYTMEFDSEFWSSYKALETLMDAETFSIVKKTLLTSKRFNRVFLKKFNINEEEFDQKQKEILKSYEVERDKSCERGTKIHAEFEQSFYKDGIQKLDKFGIKGEFTCRPHNYQLDLEMGVYPEFLISKISSDGLLKVAGQIDLLIKEGNDITLVDWKTNKEIKQKSYFNRGKGNYECMKFPLNHIMDTNYWHYTLQLSLYAYLLQQINPEFNIKLLKLIHVDHNDKVTEYEVEYLKEDVELMLKHYKKQLKVKKELDDDKPIKF